MIIHVNIFATATFQPGAAAAVLEQITAGVLAATTRASDTVRDLAKERCPVDTGALQQSIFSVVTLEGDLVTGSVVADMPYAAFVEFGVRQLGASGEWAGPYQYSSGKGFAGFGYMRGALDQSWESILDAYRSEGFVL